MSWPNIPEAFSRGWVVVVLAVCFVVVVVAVLHYGGTVNLWDLIKIVGIQPTLEPTPEPTPVPGPGIEKTITIDYVTSGEPDYVLLYNPTLDERAIGGYKIIEGDNLYIIPQGAVIGPGERIEVYFFSPKKAERKEMAIKLKEEGKFVCEDFGLKTGELVILKDKGNNKLGEMKVP